MGSKVSADIVITSLEEFNTFVANNNSYINAPYVAAYVIQMPFPILGALIRNEDKYQEHFNKLCNHRVMNIVLYEKSDILKDTIVQVNGLQGFLRRPQKHKVTIRFHKTARAVNISNILQFIKNYIPVMDATFKFAGSEKTIQASATFLSLIYSHPSVDREEDFGYRQHRIENQIMSLDSVRIIGIYISANSLKSTFLLKSVLSSWKGRDKKLILEMNCVWKDNKGGPINSVLHAARVCLTLRITTRWFYREQYSSFLRNKYFIRLTGVTYYEKYRGRANYFPLLCIAKAVMAKEEKNRVNCQTKKFLGNPEVESIASFVMKVQEK